MDCVNYLKKYQEIPYNIFKNALENNRFFHAYLLSGPTGTPIFEIAKFLSKCLLKSSNISNEDILSIAIYAFDTEEFSSVSNPYWR